VARALISGFSPKAKCWELNRGAGSVLVGHDRERVVGDAGDGDWFRGPFETVVVFIVTGVPPMGKGDVAMGW
jgi:hypothetical protein